MWLRRKVGDRLQPPAAVGGARDGGKLIVEPADLAAGAGRAEVGMYLDCAERDLGQAFHQDVADPQVLAGDPPRPRLACRAPPRLAPPPGRHPGPRRPHAPDPQTTVSGNK